MLFALVIVWFYREFRVLLSVVGVCNTCLSAYAFKFPAVDGLSYKGTTILWSINKFLLVPEADYSNSSFDCLLLWSWLYVCLMCDCIKTLRGFTLVSLAMVLWYNSGLNGVVLALVWGSNCLENQSYWVWPFAGDGFVMLKDWSVSLGFLDDQPIVLWLLLGLE